jgi:hypothetical protein
MIFATAVLAAFVLWLLTKRSPALLTRGKASDYVLGPLQFIAAGVLGWALSRSWLGAFLLDWVVVPLANFVGSWSVIDSPGGTVVLSVIVGILVLIVIATLLDLKVDKLTLNTMIWIPLLAIPAGGVLAALATSAASVFGGIGSQVSSSLLGG